MAHEFNRREMIVAAGAAASLTTLAGLMPSRAAASGPKEAGKGTYTHMLPPLPYPEDALEPVLDRQTVNIHYSKHYAGYINGLNATIQKLAQARSSGDFSAIKALSRDLAFHGSGVVLHAIYFDSLGPKAGGVPGGKLGERINKDFGSFDTFWKQFCAASKAVEASGWGVLAWEPFSRCLMVMQAEKHQDLTSWGAMPILVCDVWEHAYYLKYQNRRDEYVDNFIRIVDWQKVGDRFDKVAAVAPEKR